MFSKENVRGLSLRFDFPQETQKRALDFIREIHLGSLEMKTPYVYRVIRRLSEMAPIFEFTGEQKRGSLSQKSLRITIGEFMTGPFSDMPKKEKEKALAKVFEEKSLTDLNADINFLIGRLSAIFVESVNKMKGKADIRLVKEEKETSYNCILKDEFLRSVQEISAISLSGFRIKIPKNIGIASINLSHGTKRLICDISVKIPISHSLNILTLLSDSITTLNKYYSKLGVC